MNSRLGIVIFDPVFFKAIAFLSVRFLPVVPAMRYALPMRCTVFAIAALQPMVQEVFAISRFNLIVPCYVSVDTACKVLGT